MRKVQFWQREMARIAEPIDPENDPFSQLFDKQPPDKVVRPTDTRRSTLSVSVLSVIGVVGVFGAGYLGGEVANNWFSAPAKQKISAPLRPPAPAKPAIIAKAPNPTKTAVVALNRDPLPIATPPKLNDGRQLEQALKPENKMERGLKLIGQGDLSDARNLLQSAFDAGETDAALALGRSFDPRVVGASRGDVGKALDWYEKWYLAAVQAGSLSPKVRVDRLFAPLRRTGHAGVKP